jgi:hypothetical protein
VPTQTLYIWYGTHTCWVGFLILWLGSLGAHPNLIYMVWQHTCWVGFLTPWLWSLGDFLSPPKPYICGMATHLLGWVSDTLVRISWWFAEPTQTRHIWYTATHTCWVGFLRVGMLPTHQQLRGPGSARVGTDQLIGWHCRWTDPLTPNHCIDRLQ